MVPSTARPLGSSPTTPGSIKNKQTEPFFDLFVSVNTRCKGIKPKRCVTSFLQTICSPCLTGKGLGWVGVGERL